MTQCCMTGQEGNMQKAKQYQLLPLPYDFNALEPIISAEIMTLHYTKHHQTYVNNLNKALEQYCDAESKSDLPGMVSLQQAIRFNGGGHINHSIFWTNLIPQKTGNSSPTGPLAEAINKEFGSLDKLIEQMSSKT